METQLIPNELPGLEPDLPILDPPVESTEIQKFENSPNPTSSTIQSEVNEAPALGNAMQTDEIIAEENCILEEKENFLRDNQETNKPAEQEEISSDQNNFIINRSSIQEENNQEVNEPKISEETLDQQMMKTPIQEENENYPENNIEKNFEEESSNENNLVSAPAVEEENIQGTNEQISLEETSPNENQLTINPSIEEENKESNQETNELPKPEEIPPVETLQNESENKNIVPPCTQTTPKSTIKTPYYPQFMLSKIPSINSFDEISELIKNELQKRGEIFKLEKEEKSESSSYDVLFSFSADKNAVLALKSPIWIDLGNNENNIYRVKVEPAPGFVKYLTDLSSSLKTSKSNSSPKKETKSPPVNHELQTRTTHHHSENKNKPTESNKEKDSSKSAQKKSIPKKEIPLEIVKVHKSSPRKSKNHPHSSHRRSSRSKSRSHSRDYDRESSYERDLSPKRYPRSELKKRRESSGSIERSLRRERNAAKEFYSHGKPVRKGSMALEERKFMDNEIQRPRRNSSPKVKTICLVPAKNQKEDLRKMLKNQQQQQQKQSECWTDDQDDYEFTCYAIGVPLEYDEPYLKNLLKKDGFSGYIRVRARNFEGLDYFKITFETKSDAQRALSKPIFVNDIPIIMIPKLPNRDPFEMLSFHQLKIRSLSGPIESKIIYEFLLKFGTITDFLILDLLEFPTTFIATFTNNASKRNLAAYYPTNTARISDDKGREYSIQFELNIKPALVIRKKLKETIIYQYKEAAAQFLREMSRQIENEVIFTNPAVSSPSLIYSQQVPPPSLNPSNLISPISSHNPNPYTFSPSHTYSLSNQMSSMNLNQSPTGPFASRPSQFNNNIAPLSLPSNQNLNYNQQNTFLPNNRSHPVNTYLPHNQLPHYLQYEEPPGMIQEAPLDVDKFLAGNGNSSNQMPFNNLRGGMPNQENQYFLSNIGPGPNSNNYYQY